MIALLLAATVAPMHIAPRLDVPYTLTVHEERRHSGVAHHFATERRIVFHRDGDGLIAEMTLVRIEEDVGGTGTRRFESGAGALRGKVIRLHLAADGTVTAIDDQAALWAATMSGLIAMSGSRAPPAAAAPMLDPAALLAAVPEAQQRRMLASPLVSVLAAEETALPPGSRTVTLPGRSLPGGRPMTGTQQVERGPGQRLRITVHAADGAVQVDRERTVDAATGLVMRTDETVTIGTGADAHTVHETASFDSPVK